MRENREIDVHLVHSPLVGPATMKPLAAELAARRWRATAPDLRSSARTLGDFCAAAVRAVPTADVVIGHSGAGAVLPTVAARVGARCTVFVDAVLPAETTTYLPSPGFLDFIDTLPLHDGLLPAWHHWWPSDKVAELLPDERARRVVLDEIPAVPRSFYDDEIELPPSWWTQPACYLQLSPAYDDELARADQHRWPTARRVGGHLDLVVHPAEVADAIVELVALALPAG